MRSEIMNELLGAAVCATIMSLVASAPFIVAGWWFQ